MSHVVVSHVVSERGHVTNSPATCIYSTASYDITAYYNTAFTFTRQHDLQAMVKMSQSTQRKHLRGKWWYSNTHS